VRFTPVVAASLHITAGVALVDDQERDRGEFRKVGLARVRERGLSQFFKQGVRLAMDDAIALEDRGAADCLRQVAFAGAGGPRRSTSSRCAMKRVVASS